MATVREAAQRAADALRKPQSEPRIGQVTAVSGGRASVQIAGGVIIEDLLWAGVEPALDDRVLIDADPTGRWSIRGILSVATTVNPPEMLDMNPSAMYSGAIGFMTTEWSWTSGSPGRQGPGFLSGGGAGVWRWDLSPLDGATIYSMKLSVRRAQAGWFTSDPDLVAPRLQLHNYTSIPSGAPSFTGSIWSPFQLAYGQELVADLPTAWRTALLSGTAEGIGATATTPQTSMSFKSVRLIALYSPPPDPED
ncbi:MAG: hypothetical protein WAS05_00830 [Candidatus Nanopelagicales bacterium]